MKKNEIMLFSVTWIDVHSYQLKSEKDKYMIPLIC